MPAQHYRPADAASVIKQLVVRSAIWPRHELDISIGIERRALDMRDIRVIVLDEVDALLPKPLLNRKLGYYRQKDWAKAQRLERRDARPAGLRAPRLVAAARVVRRARAARRRSPSCGSARPRAARSRRPARCPTTCAGAGRPRRRRSCGARGAGSRWRKGPATVGGSVE